MQTEMVPLNNVQQDVVGLQVPSNEPAGDSGIFSQDESSHNDEEATSIESPEPEEAVWYAMLCYAMLCYAKVLPSLHYV